MSDHVRRADRSAASDASDGPARGRGVFCCSPWSRSQPSLSTRSRRRSWSAISATGPSARPFARRPIYLVETRNSGAAFSLGTGATVVLTLIALAVVVFILRTASRMRSTGWAVASGLVLGGAVGNLADRLFRAPGVGRGHVVDWISLFSDDGHVWPIFNIADSAIVCGAVLACMLALRGIEIDGRPSRGRDGQ